MTRTATVPNSYILAYAAEWALCLQLPLLVLQLLVGNYLTKRLTVTGIHVPKYQPMYSLYRHEPHHHHSPYLYSGR